VKKHQFHRCAKRPFIIFEHTDPEPVRKRLDGDGKEAKFDPVIGRDKEIERVIQILSRRTKTTLV